MSFSLRNLLGCFLTMVAAMALVAGSAGAQTAPAKSKSAASKSNSKGKSSRHKSAHSKSGKAQSVSAKADTTGKGSKNHRARRGAWKRKGQQKIDQDRTRQIQEALIREKYLQGEPTGVWDSSTEQAMTRYQNANGWQSKVTPDSRAIIKLGLGPDHSQDSVGIPDRRGAAPVSAITSPAPR